MARRDIHWQSRGWIWSLFGWCTSQKRLCVYFSFHSFCKWSNSQLVSPLCICLVNNSNLFSTPWNLTYRWVVRGFRFRDGHAFRTGSINLNSRPVFISYLLFFLRRIVIGPSPRFLIFFRFWRRGSIRIFLIRRNLRNRNIFLWLKRLLRFFLGIRLILILEFTAWSSFRLRLGFFSNWSLFWSVRSFLWLF